MRTLTEQTVEAFSPSGSLALAAAQSKQKFEPRQGQQQMAQAIATAITQRSSAVVEAGTGVGKTFAYLVPAVLSGARVVVSTATKTLQDQLFARDLPAVTKALGVPVRSALLKGRSSYLCLYRLDMALHGGALADRFLGKTLAAVSRFAKTTQSGDLAEMTGLDERSPALPLVTSTRENCLGSECPSAKECYVNLARKEALAADVVVVNHHLFFADMAVRESGVAQILPTAEVVIFDEAHQINEIGVGFLAKQLGTSQLLDFAKDLLATGLQQARGLTEWNVVTQALEYAARDLRLVLGKQNYAARVGWTTNAPDGVDAEKWSEALTGLTSSLAQVDAALALVAETSPEFTRLAERGQELAALVQSFADKASVDQVRWLEVGAQIKLVESPLDIADVVKKQWFPEGRNDSLDGADKAVSLRSWIFTSATLGSDDKLAWFLEGCGLQGLSQQQLAVLRVGSPFNYQAQAALYVPSNFPKPNEPEHTGSVAAIALEAAQMLGGRTLVLTTTLRALRQIGESLTASLVGSDVAVLVQGQQSKRELIDRFRAPHAASVLVASSSFWEGVDVAGDALQCVIIDKLPFPPPGDPLGEARSKRLEAQGRSSFNDYAIPEAAIALKQGTGRLIRSEGDVGVLVVCDPRLVQMGYGKRLIASLPSMPIVRTKEGWREWLGLLRGLTSRG